MQTATSALAAVVPPLASCAAMPEAAQSRAAQQMAAFNAIGYLPLPTTDDGTVTSAWQVAPDPELHDVSAVSVTVSACTTADLEAYDRLEVALHQHARLPDDREIIWSPWQYTGGGRCLHAVSADCQYLTALDRGRCRISLTQMSRSHTRGTEHLLGRRWDFCTHGGARCVALRPGTYLVPLPLDDQATMDWADMHYAAGRLYRETDADAPIPHVALRVDSLPA